MSVNEPWPIKHMAIVISILATNAILRNLKYKFSNTWHSIRYQLDQLPPTLGFGSMTTILQWQKLYNEGGITALANRQRGQQPMSQFNIKALLKKAYLRTHARRDAKTFRVCRSGGCLPKKLEALAQSKAVKENKPK